ncbi:histidine kinase dimerization/phosphoacceptor domain -containing protein [Rhodohalobacter sp.]|uniref:histidine kinase dimerization/phosphoacceptor domain -containing protein n=1 Tax=Rhodohalobacter sp. TaxID=1974210 RepID=UPI002ACDFD3A|nr:histidine kinase dimerization/phosphoacceptor domain -containing protein [Rhodohalobacter sp.]MDZ7757715.1 histidine kinase dimerization/phosphoacceptor domain -containing protein [Rhodohalobacter sp.]
MKVSRIAIVLPVFLLVCNCTLLAQQIDEVEKIYSVSEALADLDGDGNIDLLNQTVIISGRASVDNLIFNEQRLSVYIQDDNAGIQVFSGTLKADISEGDSLVVKGTIELYYDKPEIVADTVYVVDDQPRVPTPKPLSQVATNPEDYLGMLVQGRAVVSQKNASSGYRGLTVSVSDSSESILEVYISQSHRLKDEFNLELLSIGDEIEVTGVMGKFVFQTSGTVVYHVMPRTPGDIKTLGFPRKYLSYLGWFGVFTLVLIFGWNFVLRRQVKSKTHDLSVALEEKEILMQEIHHRVKNNLAKIVALLDLQISVADHPAVEKSLSNSKNRINSMTLIHEKLYQTQEYQAVRLDTYLRDLVTTIHQTYTDENQNVRLDFDMDEVSFSVDKTVVCGLLVNELVINAFKYAFTDNDEGHLSVLLKKEGENLHLRISDDGPGLPGEFGKIQGEGLGTILIQNFAEQLDAEMQVHSDKSGTSFTFTFK